MKTSLVLIILILLNTSVLISEPLALLFENVNTWIIVIIEGLLIVGFYINQAVRDIQKIVTIDFNNLKLFVTSSRPSK